MSHELFFHLDDRQPFAEGANFGDVGPYERLAGRADVLLDPLSPRYADVVDIELAPRDDQGRVRYETDVYILKPVDMARGNQRLLFDVVNRGDKRALQFFNDAAPSNAPLSLADAGNAYLLRQGYTVLWCGWQADVLPGDGRATLSVPIARDGDRDILGTVREELIVDTPGVVSMPLSGKHMTRSHPANSLDTASASLTCRQNESDARQPIAASTWEFARLGSDGRHEPSATDLYLPAGFRPGWIYEVIYTAKNPQVLGLGFAAVRDVVDFLRYEAKDASGGPNPLTASSGQPAIERGYAWGRSQSGRYLREFVYQGWNEGRGGRVFDAVWPHVTGGGRLALNLRFAHPDRFPRQHEEHLYPSDQFPFAYVETTDPWSGKTDALLRRPASDPTILHTQTASEYWQRRGSLVHTDAFGADLQEHPRVRMYLFASSQHHAAPGIPAQSGPHQNPTNPLNTSPFLRALLARLDAWLTAGNQPPPSAVPRRADGTLVSVREACQSFPKMGDVRPPSEPNRLLANSDEPDDEQVAADASELDPAHEYAVLVPATDTDGNEIPGLRTPDVAVPRATYTGWNLRTAGPGAKAMYSIVGSCLPFAESGAERDAAMDERPSLDERYGSGADYVSQVVQAAQALERRGLLLPEDVDGYVDRAKNFEAGSPSGSGA